MDASRALLLAIFAEEASIARSIAGIAEPAPFADAHSTGSIARRVIVAPARILTLGPEESSWAHRLATNT